ncbi:anti-repressor SinI family protein [Paucisalibacillus globulus]|nr:anti-repressor SinI family protein [Paucisalibacillus globulus]
MTKKQGIQVQVLIQSELDEEWIELILEAKRVGINLDEIREFLETNTTR